MLANGGGRHAADSAISYPQGINAHGALPQFLAIARMARSHMRGYEFLTRMSSFSERIVLRCRPASFFPSRPKAFAISWL